MSGMQRIGGIAAFVDAATYIVALGLLFTVLTPFVSGELEFDLFMAFLAENRSLVFAWHFIAFMVNGVFLVVLSLALYERLKAGSPSLSLIATAFGLIWAVLVFAGGLIANDGLGVVLELYGNDPMQAAVVKAAIDSVENGINSSDRLLGGLWVLLVSSAALRSGALPRALNIVGIALGVTALISSAVPALKDAGVVFGIGIILWWLWLGIVMVRTTQKPVEVPV